MYRAIIIDDEPRFRATIQKLIDWDFLGISLVGEFGDAKTALDFIQCEHPDIIFCDIKMPGMNGIELLKNIQNIDNLRFIIISGHNDFEYTKEAIRHQAFDYILKPVSQEELTGVITRAIDSLNEINLLTNKELLSNLELKKLVTTYESLLIHYAESKNISSINFCIDEFFNSLSPLFPAKLYPSLFLEFHLIAVKICENFKLDTNIISSLCTQMHFENFSSISDLSDKIKHLFQHLIKSLLVTKDSSEGKRIIEAAIEFINQNYTQKLSLEIISKKFFINPYYFSQLFKSITNKNFSNYITEKRLDKAKELLLSSDLKVYQISEMVGYNDEKSFSRMFKKHTGMSPKEFALNHNCNNN